MLSSKCSEIAQVLCLKLKLSHLSYKRFANLHRCKQGGMGKGEEKRGGCGEKGVPSLLPLPPFHFSHLPPSLPAYSCYAGYLGGNCAHVAYLAVVTKGMMGENCSSAIVSSLTSHKFHLATNKFVWSSVSLWICVTVLLQSRAFYSNKE